MESIYTCKCARLRVYYIAEAAAAAGTNINNVGYIRHAGSLQIASSIVLRWLMNHIHHHTRGHHPLPLTPYPLPPPFPHV